ncbi:hypothetical protein CPG38_13700, partial [Malaciobacter marinus]|uniref:hypothetical protein n=1 Tax=Malaciobacter marinus TaxID=505249 RepID=UPI000C09BAA5
MPISKEQLDQAQQIKGGLDTGLDEETAYNYIRSDKGDREAIEAFRNPLKTMFTMFEEPQGK